MKQQRTFHFDPPYIASKFLCGGWDKEDEISLLEYIDTLNDNGYNFVLSNTFSHRGLANEVLMEWSKKYNIDGKQGWYWEYYRNTTWLIMRKLRKALKSFIIYDMNLGRKGHYINGDEVSEGEWINHERKLKLNLIDNLTI